MCGIYLTNLSYSKSEVNSKLESIKFRGPDNTGIKIKDNLIFGHLRLSIIDLDERSNQPMTLDNYIIVFNGEIYNFIDIRHELIELGYLFNTKSDTEVLLNGYKEWGSKVVHKLNGMFAFSIYDSKKKKIFCARDRIGVKPFYYFWENGKFEICSQLRPICEGKEINNESINIYLDCGWIPSPYTIYKNVHKLPPGNILEIDLKNNTISNYEYWNLKNVKTKKITYNKAKDKVHELLIDAVKIRLKSDVAFGSFLSGGIDSALVTSIASKISNEPIKTFCVGFEDPIYDESKIAENFSNILKTDHKKIICKPEDFIKMMPNLIKVYDEPFADSSALPSLLLNKVTKEYVTVALSGDGGDESFLGYNHFAWVKYFKILAKIPYFLRYILSNFLVINFLGKVTLKIKRVLRVKSKNDFIKSIFIGFNSYLIKRDLTWLSNYEKYLDLSVDDYQKTADLNIKLWLENDSNVKVDRASMASSVEVRSPFLDYRIIEFARTLPLSFRLDKGVRKRILRDILKEYIPENVFDQPKKGFSVPIHDWIRNELKDEFKSNLNDDFLNQIPNFNVQKFKTMFRQHLSKKNNYTAYIWRVYVLSKWYQEYGFYKK